MWLAAWSQSSGVGIGCGLFGESAASCSMGQSSPMPSQRQLYRRVWSRTGRPRAGLIPSCPRPCCVAISTFGFSSTVISPPFFLWARNSHFLFTDGKKKMRHRLRWQGKGHRKISFLWGACLKYRLIAWESQRAGCSTGSGRALVPPKRSCRTHRDS